MKNTQLSLLFISLSGLLHAQSLLDYVQMEQRIFNPPGNAYIYDFAVHDSGQIYTAGSFSGSPDVNMASWPAYTITAQGSTDGFLIKYNLAGKVEWAKTLGNSAGDMEKMYQVTVNDSGLYVQSYMESNQRMGPDSILTQNRYTRVISRLDFSGNYLWSKAFITDKHAYDFPTEQPSDRLEIDAQGNVYMLAAFADSMDADPHPLASHILRKSLGNYNVGLVKLNASGDFQWAFSYPGNADMEEMSIAPDGSIFVSGIFNGSFDADPGIGVATLNNQAVGFSVYATKLSPEGNYLHSVALGDAGTTHQELMDLAVNGLGELFLAGRFQGTLNPGGVGGTGVISDSIVFSYFCKMDTALNVQWIESMGDVHIRDVNTDSQGRPFWYGHFQGAVDVISGPERLKRQNSSQSIVLVKTNRDGHYRGDMTFPSSSTTLSWGVNFDSVDNIYLGGNAAANFNPYFYGSWNGLGRSSFVLKYDTCQTMHNILAEGPLQRQLCQGDSLELRVRFPHQRITGQDWVLYHNNRLLDSNTTGSFWLYPSSSGSYYLAGRGTCNGEDDRLHYFVYVDSVYEEIRRDTLCAGASYQFRDGTTWALSHDTLFEQVYQSAQGCDSVFRTELRVMDTSAAIMMSDSGLISGVERVRYQWLDCNNGMLPVAGATHREFIPAQSGSYAVYVYGGGCGDTSACYNWNIGLDEYRSPGVHVYPNPARDHFQLSLSGGAPVEVCIYDLQGRKVREYPRVTEGENISVTGLPEGVYLLKISRGGSWTVSQPWVRRRDH